MSEKPSWLKYLETGSYGTTSTSPSSYSSTGTGYGPGLNANDDIDAGDLYNSKTKSVYNSPTSTATGTGITGLSDYLKYGGKSADDFNKTYNKFLNKAQKAGERYFEMNVGGLRNGTQLWFDSKTGDYVGTQYPKAVKGELTSYASGAGTAGTDNGVVAGAYTTTASNQPTGTTVGNYGTNTYGADSIKNYGTSLLSTLKNNDPDNYNYSDKNNIIDSEYLMGLVNDKPAAYTAPTQQNIDILGLLQSAINTPADYMAGAANLPDYGSMAKTYSFLASPDYFGVQQKLAGGNTDTKQQQIDLDRAKAAADTALATADMSGYVNGAPTLDREKLAYSQYTDLASQLGYMPMITGTAGTADPSITGGAATVNGQQGYYVPNMNQFSFINYLAGTGPTTWTPTLASRELAENTKQNSVDNLYKALALQTDSNQYDRTQALNEYLGNAETQDAYLSRVLQAAGLGQQGEQFDRTSSLNEYLGEAGVQNDYLSQLLGASQLAQQGAEANSDNQYRYDALNSDNAYKYSALNADTGYKYAALDQDRYLANIANALALGEQYGVAVQPKSSGQELFNQVEGLPTLASILADRENQLGYAQLANQLNIAGLNNSGKSSSGLTANQQWQQDKYFMGLDQEVQKKAQEKAESDERLWQPDTDALQTMLYGTKENPYSGLVTAYMNMGYDKETALQKAKQDDRYTPLLQVPEGKYTYDQLYNDYMEMYANQLPNYSGGYSSNPL